MTASVFAMTNDGIEAPYESSIETTAVRTMPEESDGGIIAGTTLLSVFGGAAKPISKYDSDSGDDGFEYGNAGETYGAQIMYFLTPVLGLGLEFNGANYRSKEETTTILGLDQKNTTKADRYSYMLAGRVNLSPSSKTRLYLPFGAGVSYFKGQHEYEGTLPSYTETASSTKPSFYAGIGVENDIADIFILGFEARYNGFWLEKDDFNGTNYLDDVSLLVKLGIKF